MGNLPPAPSLIDQHNITHLTLDDELIYVTNGMPSRDQATTYNTMDQNQMTMQPLSPHTLQPQVDPTAVYIIMTSLQDESDFATAPSLFKVNDEFENGPRLLDRDYASTEPTWYDDEQSKSHSLTRGGVRSLHGEISLDNAPSDTMRQRFQIVKDDLEIAVGTEDEARSQSFVIQSPAAGETYPQSHGGMRDDAYREVSGVEENQERRVTVSTVALVWGEVGRGLVAATEDYKGEYATILTETLALLGDLSYHHVFRSFQWIAYNYLCQKIAHN